MEFVVSNCKEAAWVRVNNHLTIIDTCFFLKRFHRQPLRDLQLAFQREPGFQIRQILREGEQPYQATLMGVPAPAGLPVPPLGEPIPKIQRKPKPKVKPDIGHNNRMPARKIKTYKAHPHKKWIPRDPEHN